VSSAFFVEAFGSSYGTWYLTSDIAIANSVGRSVGPGFASLGTSRQARTMKFGRRIRN